MGQDTCLQCGPTEPVSHEDRLTCSRCGRLLRWLDQSAPAASVPRPAAWLYVSRRLDLIWLPDEPLFGELFFLDGRPHFRLTARVAVWLEHATDALDRRWADGQLTPADRDEALAALRVVWAFAAAHLDPATLRQARTLPPELPPVPAIPEWDECHPPSRCGAGDAGR